MSYLYLGRYKRDNWRWFAACIAIAEIDQEKTTDILQFSNEREQTTRILKHYDETNRN